MQNKRIMSTLVFVAVFLVFILLMVFSNENKTEYISYNEFIEMADNNEISNVMLSENPKIQFQLKDNDTKYETDNPRNPELKEQLLLKDISVSEGKYMTIGSMFQGLLSLAIISGIFYMAYKAISRQNDKKTVSIDVSDEQADSESRYGLKDVAGNEEAKDSVAELIDFIKRPEKYSKYGARIPRGILFYGPPGTGKTLMAKAIAGEAKVPFYPVSGSDFVQMYVGVGAARIRDLFKKARGNKKAVIFIDEIDALGKKRGNTASGGNDEREQTLNALLTEMSGFTDRDGIIVIAATNRLDTLDEALLRPGRFDRQLEIGLPDKAARKKILGLHMENKPIGNSVDINDLAKQTVYFSGAMLENLLNEAAINAAKDSADYIHNNHIEKAYYTILAGDEKKDRSGIREKDRLVTAYHEAGHGLITKILSPENTISKITIIPSAKGAGGFMVNIPPDKMFYTKKELESQIMISLAGRAAEEIIFGKENITTGASNDIEKATKIVRDYGTKYGMNEKIGLINTDIIENSDANKESADLLNSLYRKTKVLLNENIGRLEKLTKALLEKETLNEDEIDEII